jgi:hypothetical protein
MSDDPKPPPLEPVPDPTTPPEKQTLAVHDDRLWGGPQHVEGLPGRPYVEGKQQYFELLNAAGLRMKHQQESVTGPTKDPPTHLPTYVPPKIVVPPMTQEEAHVYGAITAVFKHYDLIETVWCEDCFAAGRHHGCRMHVTPKRVLLECRCGPALYTPPTGTTDLVLSKLPNIARTGADQVAGTVMTALGPVARPTAILHDMEALLLRRYLGALRARHKEPRLFHRACFDGNPQRDEQALAIAASPEQLVILCDCRTLFHQSARIVRAPLQVM